MRRRALMVGLLAVGAGLVVVVLLWPQVATRPAPDSPATSMAQTAPVAPAPEPADVPARPVPVSPPASPDTRELCEWGRFEMTPSMTGLPAPVQQASNQALRQMANALIAGDPRSMARGLALRAALDYHGDPPSRGEADTVAMALQRAAARSTADRQVLAKLALGTSDVEVYKTAYLTCLPAPAAGACAQLNAAEWGRRDPSDGLAWLFAAQEAHNAKDMTARDEAFYRMSQASRLSGAWQSVSAHASDPSLSALPTSTRIGAVLTLMLLQANQPVPSYGAAIDYCPKDVAKDPVRRERCSALATALSERDTTVMGTVIGHAIGERVGWPAARLEALRDERDALRLVSDDNTVALLDDPTSCNGFVAVKRYVEEHGRLGELALLRERIRASGESVSVLAQRWRDRATAAAASPSPDAGASR